MLPEEADVAVKAALHCVHWYPEALEKEKYALTKLDLAEIAQVWRDTKAHGRGAKRTPVTKDERKALIAAVDRVIAAGVLRAIGTLVRQDTGEHWKVYYPARVSEFPGKPYGLFFLSWLIGGAGQDRGDAPRGNDRRLLSRPREGGHGLQLVEEEDRLEADSGLSRFR